MKKLRTEFQQVECINVYMPSESKHMEYTFLKHDEIFLLKLANRTDNNQLKS